LLFNKTENDDLLLLSAIFLGTTVLQRNEMTFIASIIIILALNQEKINIKNYALFLSTFLTVALSWHAYRFILLGLEKHGHGWGGLQLLAFFLYLLSFILVYFKNLRENIARNSLDISVYVSAISLASLTYIYPVGTGETLKALILLSAKIIYKHDWSVFWYVLSFIIVTDLMFINSHLGKIFVKVLFVLLMFRIMLYTIPWLSTTNLHKFQFQSGQRIMIQFFPIGYCYIYYVLFLLSKKLSLTKTH